LFVRNIQLDYKTGPSVKGKKSPAAESLPERPAAAFLSLA